MASMDLCTPEDVKNQAMLEGGSMDRIIKGLIDVASDVLEDYCDRLFLKEVRSVVYDVEQDGDAEIDIANGPVDTGETITIEFWQNDAWEAQDTTKLITRVHALTGISSMFWTGGQVWPLGRQKVKITCTDGWAEETEDLPADLRHIASRYVVYLMEQRKHDMDIHPSVQVVEGTTVSFHADAHKRILKRLDDKYRLEF